MRPPFFFASLGYLLASLQALALTPAMALSHSPYLSPHLLRVLVLFLFAGLVLHFDALFFQHPLPLLSLGSFKLHLPSSSSHHLYPSRLSSFFLPSPLFPYLTLRAFLPPYSTHSSLLAFLPIRLPLLTMAPFSPTAGARSCVVREGGPVRLPLRSLLSPPSSHNVLHALPLLLTPATLFITHGLRQFLSQMG